MAVLPLRLVGPMQSWGTQSRFTHRDTGREPSKSGIVGLLCTALGRSRDANIRDLAALRMASRADQPGRILRDYHTAGMGGVYKVGGGVQRNRLIVSERFYVSDAKFLVCLEGDKELLTEVAAALQRPRWPLFLGRKSFIPTEPVWLETTPLDVSLGDCVSSYPCLVSNSKPPDKLQIVVEDEQGSVWRQDQPVSFADRRFVKRRLRVAWVDTPSPREGC